MDDLGYYAFQQKALQLVGVDLTCYKAEQMQRRLGTLMARSNVHTFADYSRLLERDQSKQKEFRDFFTINVSEFFRDQPRFVELHQKILPALLQANRRLKIWSAGCSNGAEPYSVAMILDQLTPHQSHTLLATDIDERILARAERGEDYGAADVKNVPPQLLSRYFIKTGENRYAVKNEIKRMVSFRQHDLLTQEFDDHFDLILCRNVVIYFTNEAKDRLYRKFANALKTGGILFVGGTEIIMNAREIGLESTLCSFYRRKG